MLTRALSPQELGLLIIHNLSNGFDYELQKSVAVFDTWTSLSSSDLLWLLPQDTNVCATCQTGKYNSMLYM